MSKTKEVVSQGQKFTLQRFLQISPQKSGVVALLQRKYRACVMTKVDWDATIKQMLESKVK